MARFSRLDNGNLDEAVLDGQAFTAATERALAHGEDRAVVLIELLSPENRSTAPDTLTAAAEARIAQTIRPNDVIGRLDPGRLAVLTHQDGAARVAIRLGDRLREQFELGGEQVRLTPQIGVGYPYADVDTAADILSEAEKPPRY